MLSLSQKGHVLHAESQFIISVSVRMSLSKSETKQRSWYDLGILSPAEIFTMEETAAATLGMVAHRAAARVVVTVAANYQNLSKV